MRLNTCKILHLFSRDKYIIKPQNLRCGGEGVKVGKRNRITEQQQSRSSQGRATHTRSYREEFKMSLCSEPVKESAS
jgi:hypothetical protein